LQVVQVSCCVRVGGQEWRSGLCYQCEDLAMVTIIWEDCVSKIYTELKNFV
jgi:hypothetical protein